MEEEYLLKNKIKMKNHKINDPKFQIPNDLQSVSPKLSN